jgi:hypothetical protein
MAWFYLVSGCVDPYIYFISTLVFLASAVLFGLFVGIMNSQSAANKWSPPPDLPLSGSLSSAQYYLSLVSNLQNLASKILCGSIAQCLCAR